MYNKVEIKLPNYVSRIEPQDVKRVTRSTSSIAKGIDKLKFSCKVAPKIKAFEHSFFVRTLKQWNELPLNLREINTPDKFASDLKEHLWLILGLKPD